MKTVTCLCIIILLLGTSGCNQLYFEQPQPQGIKNEKAFPSSLQGKYLNLFNPVTGNSVAADTEILSIDENMIRYIDHKVDSFPFKSLKPRGARLEDHKLYFSPSQAFKQQVVADAVVRNDSVFASWQNIDTLFTISQEQVVRGYKGMYFLSTRSLFSNDYGRTPNPSGRSATDSVGWIVYILKPVKNKLIFYMADVNHDVPILKTITSVDEISDSSYIASPDKKQFIQFIKRGGFSNRVTLLALSKYKTP